MELRFGILTASDRSARGERLDVSGPALAELVQAQGGKVVRQAILPDERQKLAEDIQRSILEHLYFVPIFRHAFMNAIGPRIAAQKWQDVFPTITTGYAFPWEDITLKE